MPALHGARRDLVTGAEAGRPRDRAGLRQRGLRGGARDRRGRAVAGPAARRRTADPQLRAADACRPRNGSRLACCASSSCSRRMIPNDVPAAAGGEPGARARGRASGSVAAAEATAPSVGGFRSEIEVPGRTGAERRTCATSSAARATCATCGVRLLRAAAHPRTTSPAHARGGRQRDARDDPFPRPATRRATVALARLADACRRRSPSPCSSRRRHSRRGQRRRAASRAAPAVLPSPSPRRARPHIAARLARARRC